MGATSTAVEDTVLPAARHLTGPDARGVLEAALEAVGGTLGDARPSHLHYRPGRDMVVRFDGSVRWGEGAPVSETLVAATTSTGAPEGTLPVEAVTADGSTLQVGVWRWPFDPTLTGLRTAVTPSLVAPFLDGLVRGRLDLTVLVYRPTQRVVVKVVDAQGTVMYVKSLAPRALRRLAERHDLLIEAGLPVPAVLRRDDELGLMAMAELEGPTVRDRLKRGDDHLPPASEYEKVFAALAAADLPENRRTMGRAAAAVRHSAMLRTVMADGSPALAVLDHIDGLLGPVVERSAARPRATIHGDLYEAQLITGRGRGRADKIAGVLDLDDAGPGDPLDDRATVLGHLLERLADPGPRRTRRVIDYVNSLRSEFGRTVDLAELDAVTGAVLVGLATGPFRIQCRNWPDAVLRRLRFAERLLGEPGVPTLGIPE